MALVVVIGTLILVPVAWIGYRAAKFTLLGHPHDETLIPTVGVLLVCAALGAAVLSKLLTGEGPSWSYTMWFPPGLAVIGGVAHMLYASRSSQAFVAASKHLFPTITRK